MLEIHVRVRLNCVEDGYLLAFNYKIMDASMWDGQKHPAIFNLDCFIVLDVNYNKVWMYDFEGLDNLLIYSILIISMFEFDITNLNL